jgi:tRNA(Ile)-lysidine synthase
MTNQKNSDQVSHNWFEDRLARCLIDCLDQLQVASDTTSLAKKASLFQDNETILIALSGGPDSTSLLLGLKDAASSLSLHLNACHINHGQRASESDQDEQFCRAICRANDIPFSSRKMSLQDGHASEEILRDERHRLLEQEAELHKARFILFGHTADDQVETILFRLFRGTALNGLTGIKPARRTISGRYLVRPLLSFSKSECLRYLTERGVAARQDSSNLDDRYTRNFLRNRLLPLIKERFNGFGSNLERLRLVVEAEEAFFSDFLEKSLAQVIIEPDESDFWSRSRFNAQPLAIKRRLLALALKERGQSISFERIEHLIADASGNFECATSLDESWRIKFERDVIAWQFRCSENSAADNPLEEICLRVPGLNMVLARNRALRVEALGEDAKRHEITFPLSTDFEALVDLSAIKPPLVVRSRRAGDLITPFGMKEPMRLKRYLQTHKNADETADRTHIAVVADSEEVIWVPGVGLSSKVRVTTRPTHRLSWLKISSQDAALV